MPSPNVRLTFAESVVLLSLFLGPLFLMTLLLLLWGYGHTTLFKFFTPIFFVLVFFVLSFLLITLAMKKPAAARTARPAFALCVFLSLPLLSLAPWLFSTTPRQHAVACTVGHSHGEYADITVENGATLSLNFAKLEHPEKCVPIGAWIEKRRWELVIELTTARRILTVAMSSDRSHSAAAVSLVSRFLFFVENISARLPAKTRE